MFESKIDFSDLLKTMEEAKIEIDKADSNIRGFYRLIDQHREAIDMLYVNVHEQEEARQKLSGLVHSLSIAMAKSIVEQKQQLEVERLYNGLQRRNNFDIQA